LTFSVGLMGLISSFCISGGCSLLYYDINTNDRRLNSNRSGNLQMRIPQKLVKIDQMFACLQDGMYISDIHQLVWGKSGSVTVTLPKQQKS